MTREEFAARLAEAPLLMDGATGSNLMNAGMPRGVCAERWILEHPQPLLALQQQYVAAGSQLLIAPLLPPTGSIWRSTAWRIRWRPSMPRWWR